MLEVPYTHFPIYPSHFKCCIEIPYVTRSGKRILGGGNSMSKGRGEKQLCVSVCVCTRTRVHVGACSYKQFRASGVYTFERCGHAPPAG